MPRKPRMARGGLVYHVLNRAVARLPLFEKEADYEAFGNTSDVHGQSFSSMTRPARRGLRST